MESDECLDGWSGGGRGVFIALNHQNSHWGWLLSMDTPDSPVRQPRHPIIRVLTQMTVGAERGIGSNLFLNDFGG
jgi:hypothetical protein